MNISEIIKKEIGIIAKPINIIATSISEMKEYGADSDIGKVFIVEGMQQALPELRKHKKYKLKESKNTYYVNINNHIFLSMNDRLLNNIKQPNKSKQCVYCGRDLRSVVGKISHERYCKKRGIK